MAEIWHYIKRANQRRSNTLVAVAPDENARIAVESWLERQETEAFLGRVRHGLRQSIGIVTDVQDRGGQTQVNYVDQQGMHLGFVYKPGSPYFQEAQDGFQVGDIILNKLRGMEGVSVRPLRLEPEMVLRVLRKFEELFKK